jgi:superfamily II DNA or RNA helicase
MGLTATLSRDDGSRFSLLDLVGEVVYEMAVDELAGIHLADYTVETVQVPLFPEEGGSSGAGASGSAAPGTTRGWS